MDGPASMSSRRGGQLRGVGSDHHPQTGGVSLGEPDLRRLAAQSDLERRVPVPALVPQAEGLDLAQDVIGLDATVAELRGARGAEAEDVTRVVDPSRMPDRDQIRGLEVRLA